MLCSACQRVNTAELRGSAHPVVFSFLLRAKLQWHNRDFVSLNNTRLKRTASGRRFRGSNVCVLGHYEKILAQSIKLFQGLVWLRR